LCHPCVMSRAVLLVFFAACCVGCTYAFTAMMPAPQLRSPALSASGRPAPATSTTMQMESADRRGVLLAGVAALSSAVIPAPAKAADEVTFYVGAGCYWHVQHEVTEAEKKILGRKELQYTAVVGYGGGTKTGKNGKVCYHNLLMDSDYDSLGHTEVVVVKSPADKVADFASMLIPSLFKNGRRADPQDRGGQYRSALGLPGGLSGPFAEAWKKAADSSGMKLVEGKGNEGDTLKDKSIYVYDTKSFPFYPGEVYHQYHDDMVEKYGSEYGSLRAKGVERGAFAPTGCPEIGF